MKQIALLLLIILICNASFAQIKDIVQTDGITSPLHKQNIGRVTFMDGNIPIGEYKSTDFLTSFTLTRASNLNIRFFTDNSITNYLHQLAPGLPAEVLLKTGNLQFAFYIDNRFIYKDNIDHGCHFGSEQSKNTSTVFRIPLTSDKGEDLWALHMWDRFKLNGGEKALTDGTHVLKIEIRPYINLPDKSEAIVGNLVAQGQLTLKIKTPTITKKEIAVQQVQPGSDWEISGAHYDKSKIEALNTAIAKYELKEITSIVVIKEGKLLIEEYFNGAGRATLHDTRSAGKSFTSTMMGIAINDGYIKSENQTLSSFYNVKQYDNYSVKKDSIKLKDLLTMSAAFNGSDAHSDSPGNEENMYPTDNWVKFTLDLPMDAAKTNGTQWDYFTAGVVLLGDILNKSVPGGLEKYSAEKLFKPLNITNYQWQYTPQKVVNTAGSLQMCSLDYAKYAQLYKNNGLWNGKQIIPQSWVAKTFTKQLPIPQRENQYYGYLFWNKTFVYNGKDYEVFYCAGNGGNEILIFKDLPLAVVITSKAYNKPYGHPQAHKIVQDYLLPAVLQ